MTTAGERESTPICGILLHPAGHTRSPAMHTAAWRALGIRGRYLSFDVPPPRLAAAVAGARALGLRQLAVSLPHKESILEYLDEVDETAKQIGAVNTVTRNGERLCGANTDWIGGMRALEQASPLAQRRAVVLGAGGTARALCFGLRERGAHVTVLNRTVRAAESLAEELGADAAGPLEDLSRHDFDVLVNTTSVGLRSDRSPVPADVHRSGSVVLDAVYEPERTRFLRDAEQAGARVIEGKWMLVHQAAEQLRIWTGRDAPTAVMAEAFDSAGQARGAGA